VPQVPARPHSICKQRPGSQGMDKQKGGKKKHICDDCQRGIGKDVALWSEGCIVARLNLHALSSSTVCHIVSQNTF